MGGWSAVGLRALVLAGGAAHRLGGRDKALEAVGGRPLLERVLAAAAAGGAAEAVVVGPRRPVAAALPLVWTREEPPGGGPLAALAAGLAALPGADGMLAVLAADLPFLSGPVVRALAGAAAGSGAVLGDGAGRPQWLAGVWLESPLRAAVDGLVGTGERASASGLAGAGGSPLAGRPLRTLLEPLAPRVLTLPEPAGGPPPWWDCDRPDELAQARRWTG